MSRLSLLFPLLLLACGTPKPVSFPPEVTHYGALRRIMHQGDLSAQVDLRELAGRPHLYALGAVADLKGEILILDGKPLIAQAEGDQVRVDRTPNHAATLLVQAEVPAWRGQTLPDTVQTYAQLEAFLRALAADPAHFAGAPFPFRLEGEVAALAWHVIDWPEGDSVHTHHKHQTAGPHDTLRQTPVHILGFYSDRHTGLFTHHSSNMHLHMHTRDQQLAGHVDDLELTPGARLHLPARP